jgi:hypothetical protein
MPARSNISINRIDSHGFHPHENLSSARLKVRHFFQLQNFRAAKLMNSNRLHFLLRLYLKAPM